MLSMDYLHLKNEEVLTLRFRKMLKSFLHKLINPLTNEFLRSIPEELEYKSFRAYAKLANGDVVYSDNNFSVVSGEGDTYLEEFEGTTLPTGTNYNNANYTGFKGLKWNFVHVQEASNASGSDYGINGKGVLLRRANEPSSMEVTIPGGISKFSFDFRRAYDGTAERRIEVLVNGERYLVHQGPLNDDGGSRVLTYTYNGPEITEDVTIKIQMFGSTGNQHVVIDNFSWTEPGSGDVGIVRLLNVELIDSEITQFTVINNQFIEKTRGSKQSWICI